MHGGAPGHGRRRHLRARGAVHGAGHAEPDRHGGHLPAARGTARPLHRPDLDGLPGPRRRDRDARQSTRRPTRSTSLQPGLGRDRGPRADRRRARRCTSPTRSRPTRSTWPRRPVALADVRLGASPRATLQLLRASKAWAAVEGRDYVIPDDLQFLLARVLAHRHAARPPEAHVAGRTRGGRARPDRDDGAHPAAATGSRDGTGGQRTRRLPRPGADLAGAGFTHAGDLPDRRRRHRAALRTACSARSTLSRAGVLALAIPIARRAGRAPVRVQIANRRGVEPVTRRAPARPVTMHLDDHATGRCCPPGRCCSRITCPPSSPAGRGSSSPGWPAANRAVVSYRMPRLSRGRYRAGPLRIRLTDPFHMVDLVRSFTATTEFVVAPIVDPLPRGRAAALARHRRQRGQPLDRRARRRRRVDARVPHRRRPAQDPLAIVGAHRRVDGAAGGATVAGPEHTVARPARVDATRPTPPTVERTPTSGAQQQRMGHQRGGQHRHSPDGGRTQGRPGQRPATPARPRLRLAARAGRASGRGAHRAARTISDRSPASPAPRPATPR